MSLEGHKLVYLKAFHKWINDPRSKSEKEVFAEFLKYIKSQLKISVVFDVDIIDVVFESIIQSKTKKIDQSYQHIQHSRSFIVFLAKNKFIDKSHQRLAIQKIKRQEKQGNYPIIKLSKHLGACTTQEQFEQQWNDKSVILEYSTFWENHLDANDNSIKIRLNNIYESFLKTGAIDKLKSDLKNRLEQYFCTMNGADQQQTKINQLLLQWAQSKLLRQSSTLRKKLDSQYNMIKEIVSEYEQFNKIQLKIGRFGSLQNGFATQEADLDITILTNCYLDEKKIVQALGGFLKLRLEKSEFEVVSIANANIPIIQLKAKQKDSEQKIDIAVNNICGIINSRFVKVYSQFHPGVRALGVLLKSWGKNVNIINKDKMSSYSIILMMLYYLIRVKEIPIILKKITDQNTALTKIKRQKRGQKEQFQIQNCFDFNLKKRVTKFNIYKHLIGFINFYKQDGQYFSQKRAISLDLSEKELQNDKLYTIKDPFDVPHNPGRVGVSLKTQIFRQMHFFKAKLQSKKIPQIKGLFYN